MCLPGTIETVRERVEQEGLPRLDRRKVLLGAAGAALATALPAGRSSASTKSKNRLQDLTHVLRKEFPLFLGTTIPTERDVIVTVPANGFYAQRWAFWEHIGTHLDAPAHFIVGGRRVTRAHARGARAAARRDRHLQAGPPGSGCDGAAVRSRRLRAAPRANSPRRRRRHELGLGLPRGQTPTPT